jgi:ubiquinol-cytochrome c reductase cytochrome b subunit
MSTPLGNVAIGIDERFGAAKGMKKLFNKVFPDHWSFMLGEVALYSFIILLLSGTYLTLWFKPSMTEVVYQGSYLPLNGVKMSEAYASALNISFDVRGGLLMRQIHHWAALFFVASISVHMLRVFFTGAFRKPRETNWIIGVVLLVLAVVEGFAGYSLPDDLLSGTGLRIAQAIMLASPLFGSWMAFLIFGGEFPGTDFIPRLFTVHVLLVPGIMLALVAAHVGLVALQKHTQYPGPGRTNKNVVGFPLLPVYMAKAGGFFFIVFGLTTVMGALVTINPIWMFGPYVPNQVSAGSQPDWYMGFLDGAVRIMPNWELHFWNYTLSLNIMVPAMILPVVLLAAVFSYPWLEAWATGDKSEHHLLDRPRNAATRTGIGAAFLAFYIILFFSAGNDIIAHNFHLAINHITYFFRVFVFVGPVIAFWSAKRIALSLQRRDIDKLMHGRETGNVLRLPHGEFVEIHAPINEKERAKILSKPVITPMALPSATDANGVRQPNLRAKRWQAKLSAFFHRDTVEMPSAKEIEAAQQHLESGHGELTH